MMPKSQILTPPPHHIRLMAFFSRTTCVGQLQQGKPFWMFTGARDDEVALESGGPYAYHLHLAPDR